MKGKAAKSPQIVGDLGGGEIVRLASGTFRVTHRPAWNGARTAILLDDQLRETRGHVELAECLPVLEVLQVQRASAPGAEVDPLLRGGA